MKYIKTTNNIIPYDEITAHYAKENHWRISNNIEELFDEFVLYAEDYDYFNSTRKVHRHWMFDDIETARKQMIFIGAGIKRIIYGAIWITGEHDEPILKSVAKMNDEKGDLELFDTTQGKEDKL